MDDVARRHGKLEKQFERRSREEELHLFDDLDALGHGTEDGRAGDGAAEEALDRGSPSRPRPDRAEGGDLVVAALAPPASETVASPTRLPSASDVTIASAAVETFQVRVTLPSSSPGFPGRGADKDPVIVSFDIMPTETVFEVGKIEETSVERAR